MASLLGSCTGGNSDAATRTAARILANIHDQVVGTPIVIERHVGTVTAVAVLYYNGCMDNLIGRMWGHGQASGIYAVRSAATSSEQIQVLDSSRSLQVFYAPAPTARVSWTISSATIDSMSLHAGWGILIDANTFALQPETGRGILTGYSKSSKQTAQQALPTGHSLAKGCVG